MRKSLKNAAVIGMVFTLCTGILPQNIGKNLGVVQVEASQTKTIDFQSAKNYGGSYTDSFSKVEFTKDGGFVASGYTMGDSEDPKWEYHTANDSHYNNDGIVVKFDKDHKVQWSKAYGTTGVEVFNDMAVLKDGRIAVAGRSSFTSSDQNIKAVSWYILLINPDDPDDFEEYRIGGTAGDQAFGIAATSDGGFVVGGWSASKDGYMTRSTDSGKTYSETTQLWQASTGSKEGITKRNLASGSEDFVVKISASGEAEYTTAYAAQKELKKGNRLESLTVDDNDNVILTGYVDTAKNIRNATIAKLNATDGSLQWDHVAGSDLTEAPTDSSDYQTAVYSDVTVLKDGSYVVCGYSTNDATTEEQWNVTGIKDSIVVRYSSDGKLLNTESYGTIGDQYTLPSGVIADNDGGYLVFGTASGVIQADEQIKKGYDWGNYGAQDAIIIKYDENNKVSFSENYGTKNGDWINGMAINDEGEVIAVGESNGKNGNPTWGNNGGIDAIVLSSKYYEAASTQKPQIAQDKNITWADGTYQAYADGYGGNNSISIQVVIKNHKIESVTSNSNKETKSYFNKAKAIFNKIVENQSCEVDVVSGATMSSNGIIEATQKCLAKAAAKWVDEQIEAIGQAGEEEKKDLTAKAVDAYDQLGSLAASYMENLSQLESYAKDCGITIPEKVTQDSIDMKEDKPELSGQLKYNDPYYKLQQKYYKNINAETLKDKNLTGKGVRIAVLDSGITANQKDLDYTKIVEGYDYINNCKINTNSSRENMIDVNGHGTAVAGILAAITNNNIGIAGLLSDAELIPLRINSVNNPKKEEESIESSKTIAKAIRDAVDVYKADVITTSLDAKDTDELKEAVEYAESKNVIITGAAGNSSTADSTGNDAYIYPAAYDSVISVGAVDNNNQVRTSSQKNDQVYVTAPGENIVLLDVSKTGKCKISSGTSYASPVVAAMAAVAKQQDKSITPAQFKELLRETSSDLGKEGYDTSYGYGLVDMKKFAKKLLNEPDQDEVPTTEDKKTTEPTNPTKPQTIKVNKISLSAPVTNVAPGKKVRITAKVTPSAAKNKALAWSTSNKKVATVDKNGVVTFNKKAGGKTVWVIATAKDGSKKKAKIKFKVAKGEVKKITITGKKTVKAGKTIKLQAKIKASKGANKKLKWTSSNKKYATVSSSGKVKTFKAGKNKTVTIKAAATDGTGKKATMKVKIK